MSYEIVWKKEAVKDLDKIELEDKRRIIDKIEWFADYPNRKKNIKYIEKYGCMRYRVGSFRVFFLKDDENNRIEILTIDKRSQAYR